MKPVAPAERESKSAPADSLPVIQYWHAEQPPQEIAELRRTFPLHNPWLQPRMFSESSAHAFVAEHLGARQAEAFASLRLPTIQADYFRYCAGYVLGGLCIDADVRCSGDLWPLFGQPRRGRVFAERDTQPDWIERIFAWPYGVGEYRVVMNGGFAFHRAGDPLLGLAIEVATANIEQRVADGPLGVWLGAGPGVFTSVYLLHHLGSIDAFVRYATGTVLEPSAGLFCEIVEDPSRASAAFEGLDMVAVEEVNGGVLEHVGVPRGAGVKHWSRSTDSIFR